MNNFIKNINSLMPEHDHPGGLIHPYWARKPLNIIELLICTYSNKNDTILDPFMGSGTSVLAAVKNDRNIIGSDLNPTSKLFVDSMLNSTILPNRFKEILDFAVNDWIKFTLNLYQSKCGEYIERESFCVEGDYANSEFTLVFQEAKLKPLKDGKLKGATKIVKYIEYENEICEELLNAPIDFSKISFTENTRIAVHKNVKASDFFTERNIIFINYVHTFIKKHLTCEKEINFIKLFLSSMIPLLRLSDKKASSQWPYWRPKDHLTSRNPIVAINKRYVAFLNFFSWGKKYLNKPQIETNIFQCAADSIIEKHTQKVDLIITDPPYADHAPYLEYSDFYWSIISGERNHNLWSHEIVKTNAVGRENDSRCYAIRMQNSIQTILKLLKDQGYFVFFYLDKNISHWNAIKTAIYSSNCIIEDVIAISKQRRSMKAVTSPGRTLDGDLIIVCKKDDSVQNLKSPILMKDILSNIKGNNYFERFTDFIKKFMMSEVSDLPNWRITDISRLI
ncbi:TPA: hypothetical protein K8C35_002758 [Legionella pneumophila]|nr:hypothetical protein [Legionella pneumophila]